MHTYDYSEIKEARVSELLHSLAWMDTEGNDVKESAAYGCKTTYWLTHPEYCIVLDEVGDNINMEGEVHIFGVMLLM